MVADSFVVQVTVAPDAVTAAATAEMAGGVTSGVAKVRGAAGASGSEVELPAASAETTR